MTEHTVTMRRYLDKSAVRRFVVCEIVKAANGLHLEVC